MPAGADDESDDGTVISSGPAETGGDGGGGGGGVWRSGGVAYAAIPMGLTALRGSVVAFGDSLTQRGFDDGGWVARLSARYTRRADVYCRGFGGYTTRQARALLPALFPVGAGAPRHDLVTLWFGANDAAAPGERQHVPLGEFEANVAALLAHLRAAARRVVALTPPPVHGPTRLAFQQEQHGAAATGVLERTTERAGEYAAAVRRAVDAAARTGGAQVACVDVHRDMLALGEDGWAPLVGRGRPGGDGLHLSPAGQGFAFDRLAAFLDSAHPAALPADALRLDLPVGQELDFTDSAAHFARHVHAVRAVPPAKRRHADGGEAK